MLNPHSPRIALTAAVLTTTMSTAMVCAVFSPAIVHAQTAPSSQAPPAFAADAINQAQKVRVFRDRNPTAGPQGVPSIIDILTASPDPTGTAGTFKPDGATTTGDHAFFQALGTNDRSCVTCHDPRSGWTVNPPGIQARFQATQGSSPLFRLVDGATCPTAPVSTPTTLDPRACMR